ncbi:MAG TPA: penicillin acylase family protein, partial [Aggregatilineales bacterium]|nr:penicillin acylase family protein [Aggregatilineales bacterium]
MRSRRMLIYTVSILTILSIAAGVFGIYSYRRPLPQTQGALRAPGLREDVTIYRDEWGVPHIFASTTHDLLLAQGYIHAQDRWWQMEMNRHLGTGNLSSITGNNEDAQNADRFIRTTGWNQMAVQSWQNAAPELRSALNAYVQGVNGYIADLDQGELAVQYTLLGLTGRGFEVMPWEPVHSLAWAVAFNWSQSGNLIDEIESAQQLAALTPSLRTYFPLLEGEIFDYTGVNTALIADDLAFLDMQTPPRSSSWVVSGALTENGAPLLAADMQAGIHIPPQWYEIGLHCIELTANCPYDVVGFSL